MRANTRAFLTMFGVLPRVIQFGAEWQYVRCQRGILCLCRHVSWIFRRLSGRCLHGVDTDWD
jgi:hypothetical protein